MNHELIVNLHMHTRYSDGHGSHSDIAQAALAAGIDAAIVTDHNVWVNGPEQYYRKDGKRALLMVGEEIHDQARQPQKNHLLVFGADRELAALASKPQELIDGVRKVGGICFLAHPVDPAAPAFGEDDISWVDWQVNGYTGLELWNAMSEFKSLLKSKLHAIYYAYNPQRVARGPFPEAVRKWDELLASGKKLVAIGGSDAHQLPARLGPLQRILFPYEFHFRCVNTHVLLSQPLGGEEIEDRQLILGALSKGHAFIGYDLPAPTRGFRFSAQGRNGTAWMGDEISARGGVTLKVRLPLAVECRLLKDGKVLKTWNKRETYTYITSDPGVYRVEAFILHKGLLRQWIISNPIYLI